MPATFKKDKIEENHKKYFQFLQSLQANSDSAPIGVFVGKFKEFGSALNFSVLHVKHLGKHNTLLIDENSVPKILKKHQSAFDMQCVYPKLKLFFIATVVNFHDRLKIETIDFMLLTSEFLPLEPYDHDWRLQRQLIEDRRYFDKPLRFSLPVAKPLTSAVLMDTPDTPVALMFDCNLPDYHDVNEQDAIATDYLGNLDHVGEMHDVVAESNECSEASENHDHQKEIDLPDNMVVIRHNEYKWELPKSR